MLLYLVFVFSFLLHLLSQTTPNYQVQQTFVPQAVPQQDLVPQAESGRAFLPSIQATKVTIFSHSLRDVSSKLLCDHKSITLPVLFTFLHPIFFSTVLTLPLSFLILLLLLQLVRLVLFLKFLSDFWLALTDHFLSLPQPLPQPLRLVFILKLIT